METKELDTSIQRDYANFCVYIKQIESINLLQLYGALKSYLSCLILPESDQYLSVFETHLLDKHSWLSKAHLLTQLDANSDFAHAQTATTNSDKPLWEDVAKKIDYLVGSWDDDILLACQQIIEGIAMLINDKIPLADVQGEIIEFAKARDVSPFITDSEHNLEKQFQHLLHDSWVNSASQLARMTRTVAVQADLFLNRLNGASPDNLDLRQSFLFEANYKICQFIESQTQSLKTCIPLLAQKVAARITSRVERLSISSVLQRYHLLAKVSLEEEISPADELAHAIQEEIESIELETAPEAKTFVPQEEIVLETKITEELPLTTISSSGTHEHIEGIFNGSEQLLTNVAKQVAIHRLQLSCFSRIKACYGKFTLFPVFRKIATHLSGYHQSLSDSLSRLSAAGTIEALPDEHHHRYKTLSKAVEYNLTQVQTYLKTLDVHHRDYSVNEEITHWQIRLHAMIFGSSEEELVLIESHLQRIEGIDSPYLRATLIMKFDITKSKLNQMIIANMQSWSSRFVDKETVINTLSYLGIRIHPTHLSKIAPNIHLPKKRTHQTKNFYSLAADYGVAAWHLMKDWLDKRFIN